MSAVSSRLPLLARQARIAGSSVRARWPRRSCYSTQPATSLLDNLRSLQPYFAPSDESIAQPAASAVWQTRISRALPAQGSAPSDAHEVVVIVRPDGADILAALLEDGLNDIQSDVPNALHEMRSRSGSNEATVVKYGSKLTKDANTLYAPLPWLRESKLNLVETSCQ